jgi:hypothetical protein
MFFCCSAAIDIVLGGPPCVDYSEGAHFNNRASKEAFVLLQTNFFFEPAIHSI